MNTAADLKLDLGPFGFTFGAQEWRGFKAVSMSLAAICGQTQSCILPTAIMGAVHRQRVKHLSPYYFTPSLTPLPTRMR